MSENTNCTNHRTAARSIANEARERDRLDATPFGVRRFRRADARATLNPDRAMDAGCVALARSRRIHTMTQAQARA